MASTGRFICRMRRNISSFRRMYNIVCLEKSSRFSLLWKAAVLRRSVIGLALPFVPTVHAFWGSGAKTEPEPEKSKEEIIIEEADKLYKENEIDRLYEFLQPHRNSGNADILWRMARAACEMGKNIGKDPEKKNFMYEAYDHITKALEVDDNNFAVHKWYAILLDYTGEYEGTKQRISNAYKVKEHLLKSIELKPSDATSIYSLGYWCFLFADLPWYQRKIAAVIFTSPPSSSYEEALEYFLKAEEVDPKFYSQNLLMLAKTFSRLGDKKMSLLYLTKVRDYPIKTADDREAHKEATELLKQMGSN